MLRWIAAGGIFARLGSCGAEGEPEKQQDGRNGAPDCHRNKKKGVYYRQTPEIEMEPR